MKSQTTARVYNSFALILALIGLFTAWLWTYYINLFIALPSLIGAFLLCKLANSASPHNTFTTLNYALIAAAIVVGLISLFLFLAHN